MRAAGAALVGPLGALGGCGGSGERTPVPALSGYSMGTSYRIVLSRAAEHIAGAALQARVDAILDGIDQRMSTFRADSEVSRFNRAEAGAPVALSGDTHRVIAAALRFGRLSGGAFDVTVDPLVALWGFGAARPRIHPPAAGAVDTARHRVGQANVLAEDASAVIAKRRSGVAIDLSGIAKGFAVDRIAAMLEDAGVCGYLVELGGEIRLRGLNPRGTPWLVGVEKPVDLGVPSVHRTLALNGGAVATSGDYRAFFEDAGRRYAHIIDPHSGRPAENALASVTVVAPSAMQADALSTALMVMGPAEGAGLAERLGIAALFLVRDGSGLAEIRSGGVERLFVG